MASSSRAAAPSTAGVGFRAGGFRGGAGGPGGVHPLPPIAGTIHERGNQAYVTSFGHANTAVASPWTRRAGIYEVGRGQAANYGQQGHWAGYGQQQHWQGYGQQRWQSFGEQRMWSHGGERTAGSANGFGRERFGRERAEGRLGIRERLRFAELRRARGFGYGGYGGSGYGGSGDDSGSYDSGDIGSSPAAGTYGSVGTTGSAGSYADAGSYGDAGTYPAPGVYESELGGPGHRYRSETPLAARYVEAPLAPSPYGGFDAGNSYADAASRDVGTGFGPRIIHVRDEPGRCTCAPTAAAMPVVYRYGIGTAY